MSKVIGKGVIANRFIDYTFQDKYVLFIESMNDFNSSNFEKVREEELSIKNNLSKYPNSTFVYFMYYFTSFHALLGTSICGT